MKTVVIVCSGLNQFNYYMHDTLLNAKEFKTRGGSEYICDGVRYIYPFDVNKLRGLRDCEYRYRGTYYDRADLDAIREEEYCSLAASGSFPISPLVNTTSSLLQTTVFS